MGSTNIVASILLRLPIERDSSYILISRHIYFFFLFFPSLFLPPFLTARGGFPCFMYDKLKYLCLIFPCNALGCTGLSVLMEWIMIGLSLVTSTPPFGCACSWFTKLAYSEGLQKEGQPAVSCASVFRFVY